MDTLLNIVFGFFYSIWWVISGIFKLIGTLIARVLKATGDRIVNHLSWLLYFIIAAVAAYFISLIFK